ncbi:MAG: hypothetical protein M3Z32_06175 [Acidobacteriota bacterium]|nr:hypothetical protein [Acidobacteriota bacterium]
MKVNKPRRMFWPRIVQNAFKRFNRLPHQETQVRSERKQNLKRGFMKTYAKLRAVASIRPHHNRVIGREQRKWGKVRAEYPVHAA